MMRVAIGSIVHEANTFSPRRMRWSDVQAQPFLAGDAVITGAATQDTAIPGFLGLAGRTEVEWVPLISSALPGGAGPLTVDAFERLRDEFTGRLAAAGPVDACLLSMGGGMVADREDLEDADGLLLSAVREVLPPGGRLGVALDMHANVTERMVAAADVLLAYQTFPPHWDKGEIGGQVADLVHRAVLGEVEPVMALARPPMLLQPESQDTTRSPMRDAMALAREASRAKGILAVSMVAGFAWCDVPEAGTSVIVVADRDRALADRTAEDLARRWFSLRDGFRFPLTPIEEAVERALAHRGPRPLLLCDPADNAGAGGAGDSTALLERLLARGVTNAAFATLCDPDAVAACTAAGVGGAVELTLGGTLDPAHSRPIAVSGTVRALSDGQYRNSGPLWTGAAGRLGRTAVLGVGGVEVVVTERPNGAFDPAVFTSVGVDPTRKAVVVVRSQIFGPRAYAGLVDDVVVVDGDGWATSNFAKLPYRRVRRPIFPLDAEVVFG
jgi:microcystin degradation protein MlrC